MQKHVSGLTVACLMVFVTGCASSSDPAAWSRCDCPTVPSHLTSELPAPERLLSSQRGLLLLLAEYEALRRRANADRVAVVEIIDGGDRGSVEE